MPLLRHPALGDVQEKREPLGLLILPVTLEAFALAEPARRLLAVPRVLALEPPRMEPPRLLRHSAPFRQAKRLKLPGEPRVVVLFDPGQYPLARAVCARFTGAELWYVRPEPDQRAPAADPRADLDEYDALASERAGLGHVLRWEDTLERRDESLWGSLRELGVISSRPFFPDGRIGRR
jgi:hypothetical protein